MPGTSRNLILAIEISNPSAAAARGAGADVALGEMGPNGSGAVRVLGVEPLRSPAAGSHGGHDDDLMPAIDRLFTGVARSPAELAVVGVSAGPGGYTGVRIACAAGAMIAIGASGGQARACGCVRVRSAAVAFEGLDERVRLSGPTGVLLASKGEKAWCEVFAPGKREPVVLGEIDADDLAGDADTCGGLIGRGVRTLVGDRFVPESIRARAGALGMAMVEPCYSAETLLRLTAIGEAIDPAQLTPIYPREPDAVRLWRARKAE